MTAHDAVTPISDSRRHLHHNQPGQARGTQSAHASNLVWSYVWLCGSRTTRSSATPTRRRWSGVDGSIDWLCLPHFDSAAVFAGLLGDDTHGQWKIAPHEVAIHSSSRRYRGDTLVLETEFETATGVARVVDAMMPVQDEHVVLRMVEGISGRVKMRSDLRMRFDYGSVVPWVRRVGDGTCAIAGPDALTLRSDVPHDGRDMATVGDFEISNGESLTFQLVYHRSHRDPSPALDVRAEIDHVEAWWANWMCGFNYDGRWQDAVRRSVITLKALTYASTGGIVAAATTSLPEQLGGVRNWDYRFCWLRDATITLIALIDAGFVAEAKAWREWLLRAIARRSVEAADHVRGRRRAAAAGVGGSLAAGLSGRGAGAHRQRGRAAVPARRLRRGHGRPARGAPDPDRPRGEGRHGSFRDEPRRHRVGACSASSWTSSRPDGRSRTRASGRSAGRAGISCTRR